MPACHFKATRLALDKNFEKLPDKKIEDIVKNEILPEYARDEKVGTFRIDSNKEASNEYEVKIFVRPEHYKQFEYLVNEIKSAIEREARVCE